MVLRNLGDGNIDLNVTCVTKLHPVDAVKCYKLCFKLYVLMEMVYVNMSATQYKQLA